MNKETRNIYLYSATGIIFAVGFAVYSALGPVDKMLNSYVGTLASIDRSLASIDRTLAPVNKMASPYANKLKDGCYQIFGSAVLDRPGCYILQEDIKIEKRNGFFLYIKSSDVAVDLNGKTVTGPGQFSLHSGVFIKGGENIIIKNGTIKDFMFGIRADDGVDKKRIDDEPLKSVYIENVDVVNASIFGIILKVEEVFLRENSVFRVLSEQEDIKYDYIYDIYVESKYCYYKAANKIEKKESEKKIPLIVLPKNCNIRN